MFLKLSYLFHNIINYFIEAFSNPRVFLLLHFNFHWFLCWPPTCKTNRNSTSPECEWSVKNDLWNGANGLRRQRTYNRTIMHIALSFRILLLLKCFFVLSRSCRLWIRDDWERCFVNGNGCNTFDFFSNFSFQLQRTVTKRWCPMCRGLPK